MSLTIDQNGKSLAETVDGITLPVDCSFEKVNGWIHGVDVHFEELQSLCLGMSAENDKLRMALINIKNHIEISGGEMAKMTGTWAIADKALKA